MASQITKPMLLNTTGRDMVDAINNVANILNHNKKIYGNLIYGMFIDGNESDPYRRVTYIADAEGFMPAYMDFNGNKFNWGDWFGAFFLPKPCMLKSDGTVAYYLDPDDYTKKEDGTASDVDDPTFDGNAMMEWGQNGKKIWVKIVPADNGISGYVYIANYKVDQYYYDYCFHDSNGESADHFYTPIYNGSVISGKMRSLSGQAVSSGTTASQEIAYAKENNPTGIDIWDIETIADRMLINFLLILIGKSTNTQAVFGRGLADGGNSSINNGFRTGVHDNKGLFYGSSNGGASTYGNAVKVFGMENYWGFQWRRTNGLINLNGTQYFKLTYKQEDGSTTDGYNLTGIGYISSGVSLSGSNGGYISGVTFTDKGMFNRYMGGSDSTYFCDGTWFNNSGTQFALVGGYSVDGLLCGAFYLGLNLGPGFSDWNFGAALSCKPLKR